MSLIISIICATTCAVCSSITNNSCQVRGLGSMSLLAFPFPIRLVGRDFSVGKVGKVRDEWRRSGAITVRHDKLCR
jgi:hypothetical protein